MTKLKSSVLALLSTAVLSSACVQNIEQALNLKSNDKKKSSKKVTNSRDTNTILSDEGIDLQIISETQLKQAALTKSILSISNSKVMRILADLPQGASAESIASPEVKSPNETLMVGFPIGLVGEQNIFGGVITHVSDSKSDLLGGLKLTDLPPIHTRTVISRGPDDKMSLTLVGCMYQCDEDSEVQPLINFPIVGFNREKELLIVDMSAIGQELDLISMLDPKGEYTQLKAISSDVTSVEFDMKTLVFDIKTKMIPIPKTNPETNTDPSLSMPVAEPQLVPGSVPVTELSVRWYLKLNSGSNPAFIARDAVNEVGFFKTERAKNSKITRFSTTASNGKGLATVKYYVKDVPAEYRPFFKNALDSWNQEFKKTIGRDLLSYEFVEGEQAAALVPGDIRFNIIEWDKANIASYGGLGPSIANQYTGETMSANVLIQGPKIVELYTKWFEVSQKINQMKAKGLDNEAAKLLKIFNAQASAERARLAAPKFEMKLGKNLIMNVRSQQENLEDPLAPVKTFEVAPAGLTYMEYMEGYFQEIVAHEIGHNLGLRHNFKGNLGAIDMANEHGSVSRSIMEYLGRGFRHLNGIGLYDQMAIAYGYKGVKPTQKNWFCTDEDQGSDAKSLAIKSPECSKSDATSDPFSFWESRMARAIDLLVDTKSNEAPVWTYQEISSQVTEAVTGLSAYALSAESTAKTWTNFFGRGDRPEDIKEVKNYVLNKIKKKICNPALASIIAAKETAMAREAAETNLIALRKAVADKTKELNLYSASDIGCAE